jgi:hypothetical protein
MKSTLTTLLESLGSGALSTSSVITWGSPIPAFGDPRRARVATLGLNPSDREFVDGVGDELDGEERRFHTLRSLGIERWSDATEEHVRLILESCAHYFARNPYDTWFRRLDWIIGRTGASYYDSIDAACHLDLVPYATQCKWTSLQAWQWRALLSNVGDTLGQLIRESPIRILVLNGSSVVRGLECLAGIQLERRPIKSWDLPQRNGRVVRGYAFAARTRKLAGIELEKDLLVLGYNHNLQSSFGVTREVLTSIRRWIGARAAEIA